MGKHTEHLNLRLKSEHLDLLRRAASQSGMSMSEWVRARLSEAAERELREVHS